MTIDRDLARHLATKPDVIIEEAALEHGVSAREVIAALPAAMRRFGPAAAFQEVMADIAGWGEVTVIVHTADGIFEVTGEVPRGEIGRGYFNLIATRGLHGHLRHERCGGIAFVERPFMGRPSAAVMVLNREGGIMFKVFVGRDAERNLRADQVERLRALADHVCRAEQAA